MTNTIPSRDIGVLIGNMVHQQQGCGEVRGLMRIANLVQARRLELEQRLNLVPEAQQPELND